MANALGVPNATRSILLFEN